MSIPQRLVDRWRVARTSIRGKLVALATIAVAAFLLVVAAESMAIRSILRQVEREDLVRRVRRARQLFERREDTKANLVGEFAFWDEAWDLADHPVGPEAERFIRQNYVEWLPVRYGDKVIEIWDRRRNPILRWADPSLAGIEQQLDHQRLFSLMEQRKLVAGFVPTPKGLVLVGMALIMRTSDHLLQGPSNGYVIVGYPLDSIAIAQISAELQENLLILPPVGVWAADSMNSRTVAGGDSLEATFALPGLYGDPAGLVVMRSSRSFTRGLAKSGYILLGGTVLLGVVVVTLVWRSGNRLVIGPLGEIAESLDQMQQHGVINRLETVPPTREWRLFVTAFNGTIDALQSSEKRYQVLFNHAVDAHFLLDAPTQTILEANPAAEALAGCDRLDMIGRPFVTVVHLEPAPDNLGTFRLRRRDGTVRTVSVASAEVDIGGARRQLASLRDLTHNEALAAQLRQAQKIEAVGSLAGWVAHDFNNLLGTVLMATSSLRAETQGNRPAEESIGTIEQASRRAAELTRRLLSFARRDHQRAAAVSVNTVLNNVVRLCERTFDRAIRIEVDAAADLPNVAGDSGQLEQALLNLCINARDAMPAGGTLRLATQRRELDDVAVSALRDLRVGPYVLLTIADTGPGLTAEAERHLFEPFFTTKGQGKGTGLGLPMVYGIVRSHSGAIRVRNQPGRGVTFEIFLPATPAMVATPVLLPVGKPPRGSERVLVIDDEPALRSVVGRALTRLGYTVDLAENGVKGTQLFSQSPEELDLILLDIVMPEMGGVETFQRLRKIRPTVPILICSGYSADTEWRELLESGANGFLQKPFDTLDLARLVREILDGTKEAKDQVSPPFT